MDHQLDVNLELVVSQQGTAILNLINGEVVKSSGALAGPNYVALLATLDRIIKDCLKCLKMEPLKRISIIFNDSSFVITTVENYAYIAKVAN